MMRWWQAGWLALALAAGAPARADADGEQDAYLRAMRLMTENRYDEAKTALERLIAQEPQHAGAWLDLAITHCELGDAAEAERLFREIEVRFTPSAGILEVINGHRLRGCRGWHPRVVRNVTLLRARDTNVNQGASNPIFISGSTEVKLADDFLPRRDNFTQATFDYSRELNPQGALALLQLRTRRHDRLQELDSNSLTAGAERPLSLGQWSLRAVGSAGLVSLGGKLYQKQGQLQLWVAPPLPLPEHVYLLGTAALGRVAYADRPSFNASTAEAGYVLSYRGEHAQAQAGSGYLIDHGAPDRLGGDRHGWYANLQALRRWGERWQGELSWSRQDWQGQTVYSPGLIDIVRLQSTRQWRATLVRDVAPHHSVLVEWRHVRNKENISLYQYNSQSLQLSWRWNGF